MMPDLWKSLTDGFMPHGFCLRWDGPLLFVFIAGNLGIAVAYFLIPLALRYFIGKRKDLPYAHMFRLFAAFILSCGVTHLAKIWTIYQPAYWVEAFVDLWTAGVSLVTAALLFPLIPKALQLRSPKALEEANERLKEQIEETKKAEAKAEAALAEAEEARDLAIQANNLKSEFVANISHEIRTPLSGVIGLAELLSNDPFSEDAPELASRIFSSSGRLLTVLNSVLDFSKLEAGKVRTESVAFSPSQIIEDVVTLIQPSAQSRKVTVEVSLDPNLPSRLVGDESKIRQVLLNFAHNAVKFTAEGRVQISAVVEKQTEKDVSVRISVSDTGIGMDEEVRSRLFQPFVQADGSTSRRFGGTGLGLAIAKQFVELMQGSIGVTSEPGSGSTFWFTIKLDKVSS